jgi:hypothetical protein
MRRSGVKEGYPLILPTTRTFTSKISGYDTNILIGLSDTAPSTQRARLCTCISKSGLQYRVYSARSILYPDRRNIVGSLS